MTTNIRDLEAAWHAEPADFQAFRSLADHYRAQGDWRALTSIHAKSGAGLRESEGFGEWLLDALESIEEGVTEPQERGALLVAIGDAAMRYLDHRERAMKAYQASFKAYPHDTTCLDRARDIYRRLEDFERILLLYKLELKVKTEPGPRAAALVDVAQIYGDDMGDFASAKTMLVEARKLRAEHPFAAELEGIYEAGETILSRIEGVIAEAAEARDAGDDELAAVFMYEAARLEWRRASGSKQSACDYAEVSRQLDPSNDEAVTLYHDLLRGLGREQESGGVGQPSNGVEELRVEDELEDAPAREEATQDEPEDQPEDDVALEEESLVEAGDGAADGAAADFDEPVDDEPVDDEPVAEEVEPVTGTKGELMQRLDANPADLGALRALRLLCLDEGDLDTLVTRYEHSLKHLRKQPGELEVMIDLGSVYWKELEDLEQAEYYFKRVKLLDTEHEQMLAFYEAYFERHGDWRKLFALLSTAQQHSDDPARKLAYAERLAEVAEQKMENPDKAIDVWKGYLREVASTDASTNDASTHGAREELHRLYRANAKWSALVDFYKEDLHALADDAVVERVSLLERMASIYAEHLHLEPMVINTLQDVISLDPDHVDAFAQLRELLDRGRRYNDLATLLSDRAEACAEAGDLASAVDLLGEVAAIWQERLKNVTQALPYLERILELDPGQVEVREKLKAIYEQRRDFESLFDVLRREADDLGDSERVDRLRELVTLALERLRKPELAVPVLTQLVALEPHDADAVGQLEAIHRKSQSWAALAALLESKAEAASDDAARVAALAEAADLCGDQLGELSRSAELWREVLRLEPDNMQAVGSLTAAYVAGRDFEALDELYRNRGDLDRLYDLLDSLAGTLPDEELRRDLYRRLARVAEADLADADRVIISLESLRELDDADAVVQELIGWYRQVGDVANEIEMNRVLLERADDEQARMERLEILSELEAGREGFEQALHWAMEAVVLEPLRQERLERAESLARSADAVGQLIVGLDELAELRDDAAVQESLWARIGNLQWRELGDLDSAIGYFERLAQANPSQQEYFAALEALYDATGQADRRVATLRAQIDLLVEGGATRADMVDELSKIADVQRSELGEPEAARKTYAEILDLDPNHLPSLRGMKEIHREEGSWDDVVICLLREEGLVPLDDAESRLRVWMELAELYRLQRDDLAEALRYCGQVLAEDPEHEEAVRAVEALLSEPNFAREAALLIEPLFRDSDRPEQLAVALEARRAATDDRFEEQEILDELIPLYSERLGDTSTAFERACRQFEIDPDRKEIWLRLEQLGAKQDEWDRLEQIFSRFQPADSGAHPTRFELMRHLAAIREYRLGMKVEALEVWERLYDYDSYELAHVEALLRLYRELGRHDDLVRVLLIRAEIAEEDAERLELLADAARIADEVLADTPRTIEIHRKVLLIEPGEPGAVEGLRDLLRRSAQWADLEDLLLQQVDVTADPERRRAMLIELASLRFDELNDAAGGVTLLREILDAAPDAAQALAELQRFDARLAERDPAGMLRLELAGVAEPIYRAGDDAARLAEVLEVRLVHTLDPFDRLQLLDELAALYAERLDQDDAAFEMTAEAVRISSDDAQRRSRLEEMAERLQRWPEVLDAYRAAVAEADALAGADLWKRIAQIAESVVGDFDAAVEAYEEARRVNESDEELLGALEGLYEQLGRHEDLAAVLRQQTLFGNPDRRPDFLRRLAVLEEEILQRPVEAIEAYNELLQLDPDLDEALRALERLYRAETRWADLADVLRRRAEATVDGPTRIEALRGLAVVREEQLHEAQAAIDAYRQILAVEPMDVAALDELERLYAAELQWSDLADVLRMKRVSPAGDAPAEREAIELRLAGVLADELFAAEEALELYRAVLDQNPGQLDAVAALERMAADEAHVDLVAADLLAHYERVEAWQPLVDLYDRLQQKALDPQRRADYFQAIAVVRRDGLGDATGAIDALARGWALDVERVETEAMLLELATTHAAWEQLAGVYRDVLVEVNDPERLRNLRMRLANLYDDQIDDPKQAELQYREVLALDERYGPAFDALQRILAGTERWHDLVDLLERRFQATLMEAPDASREVLHRIAEVQDSVLDDGFTAVETYGRILDLEPGDAVARDATNRLLRDQERWQDLVAHLNRQIGMLAEADAILATKSELAEVLLGNLRDPAGALELYREILDIELDHGPSVEALEALLEADPGMGAEVAELLEPVYRYRRDWTRLAELLSAKVDLIDDPVEQGVVLREVARIAEAELAEPGRALKTYRRIFSLDPADRPVREALKRLGQQTQSWGLLSEALGQVLRDNFTVGDDLRIELLVERARIQEARQEDLVEARASYEELLVLDPEHAGALDALDRIYSRQQDWQALGELYRRRADMEAEPDVRAVWLEHLAGLQEEVLGDALAAIDVYYELHNLIPEDEATRRGLERLLAQTERWHDLSELYRQQAELAREPEAVLERRFRLAQLLESELEQFEEALALYRGILGADPKHLETRRALEGLNRDLAIRDDAPPEHRIGIIDLLLSAYEPVRDRDRILAMLEEKVDLTEDIAGRVTLYNQLAELLEAAAGSEYRMQALGARAKAFRADPRDVELHEKAWMLAAEADGWERLVPEYLAGLEETADPDAQVNLLSAIADVYAGPLADQDSAISAFQQIIEITDDHPKALSELERLYGELELWDRLVEVLTRRIDAVYDGEVQRDLLERVASLQEGPVADPTGAIESYERLRELEPAESRYVDALERLYEQAEDFHALADLLRTKIALQTEDLARAASFRELARIQDRVLENPEEAIESYRAVLELDANDVDAVRALSRLYERTERWPELLGILSIERDFAGGLHELNAVEQRTGNILLDKMDAALEAMGHFAAVLQRDSDFEPARDGVLRLLDRPETREEATAILEGVFRESEEWRELEDLYERQFDGVEDRVRRREIYLRLATLQESELDNASMAFVTLGRAVRELTGDEELRASLERLSALLDNGDELIAVYEDCLEAGGGAGGDEDPSVALALHRRLGNLYEALEESAEAIRHFEAALRIDEYDHQVLVSLDQLYQIEQRFEDLRRVLEQQLTTVHPEGLNDVRFRLGYLHEVLFDDPAAGLDFYRQIVIEESAHVGALEGLERILEQPELRLEVANLLEPIYQQKGEVDHLVRLYDLKVEVVELAAERAELLERVAVLQVERLGRPEAAFGYLCRSLREDPHNPGVQSRLEGLLEKTGMHEELVAIYEEIIEDLDDPVRVIELALEAADVARNVLQASVQARALYERVLELDVENARALEALEVLAREEGDLEAMAMVLRRKVEVLFDPDERCQTLVTLAETLSELERFDEAIDAYREALHTDDSNIALMHALVGLLEITERYEELVELLERLVQFVDDDARFALYVRVGQYARVLLTDEERAIDAYRNASNLAPGNDEVLVSLQELYRSTAQWEPLREVLMRRLAIAEDKELKADLYVTSARISYDVFEEAGRAIDEYRQARQLDSSNREVVQRLDELYRQEMRWEDLSRLYEEVLRSVPEAELDRRLDIQITMADISAKHLGDLDGAITYLSGILDADSTHLRALAVLAGLYAEQGEWESMLEVLERRIDGAGTSAEQIEALLQRARVLTQRVERPVDAATDYVRIVEMEPTHPEAMAELKSLYTQLSAYEQLFAILEFEASHVDDDAAKVELFLEMAGIADEALDDPAKKIHALELAHELREGDLAVVEPLLDAYIAGGMTDRAAPLLDAIVEQLRGERRMKEVVRFLHLQGKLAEQDGDFDAAQKAYEGAHRVDASYIPNLLSLGKLLYQREDWDSALKILQTLLLHQMNIDSDRDKVDVYYFLGMVRWKQGDDRRAKDMFNRALNIDAGHEASREALGQI